MADDTYYTLIRDELIRSKKLTPNEKAVLFVLLTYGDCKEIYLRQGRIAEEANMHRDTAHRTIKSLKDKGYISTKETTDRSTLLYKLLTKTVTAKTDKGYCLNRQGVTAKTDTSIKSTSIKTIEKKEKAPAADKNKELTTKVILLWNEVSGDNLQPSTKQYRDSVKWCIGQFNGLDDAGKLAKFRYAFENKKRMFDDPAHILSQFNLPMLLRKTKFIGNVDAKEYGVDKVDHRSREQKVQDMEDAQREQARP